MPESLNQEMRNSLSRLVGQDCWSVIAGKGAGSHALFDFGGKIERKQRLSNRHLTPDQQVYDGEFGLFLQNCSWRVDSTEAVIGGWQDDNSNDGPMLATLKLLVGSKVKDIQVTAPAHDLKVIFENGLTLTAFCGQTSVDEDYDDYSVSTSDGTYTVGTKGKIRFER